MGRKEAFVYMAWLLLILFPFVLPFRHSPQAVAHNSHTASVPAAHTTHTHSPHVPSPTTVAPPEQPVINQYPVFPRAAVNIGTCLSVWFPPDLPPSYRLLGGDCFKSVISLLTNMSSVISLMQ